MVEHGFHAALDGPGGVFAQAYIGRPERESGPKCFSCVTQGRDNYLMPVSVLEVTNGVTLPELIDRWDNSKFTHRWCGLPTSSVQDTITLTFP